MTARAPGACAQARAALARGDVAAAERIVGGLVQEEFGLEVAVVAINRDRYSLNSVNGRVTLRDGTGYFFKFHQEEDEAATIREYYQAATLEHAGYRVDVPAHACGKVGRQILLYRLRDDRRLADLCLEVERGTADADLSAALVAAQEESDRHVARCMLASLHPADAASSRAEPIHALFHSRLVDEIGSDRLGGRCLRFYDGARFDFPGLTLDWAELARLRWIINGIAYQHTVLELFERSRQLLHPDRLAGPAVVAHGDAHNANVWFAREPGPAQSDAAPTLVFFDPAFAGAHVPALLAEIKPTFHNIFAHPFWLYHPEEASGRFRAAMRLDGNRLLVEHDWALPPLRRAFLDAKALQLWRPLLARLAQEAWLDPVWRAILRSALFCCPTLVLDLRAGVGGRTPLASALGWSIAVMLGSEPVRVEDQDEVTRFLDRIAPA